jgi:hypothetical protein
MDALSRPENYKIARIYAMYTESTNRFLSVRFLISWPTVAILFAILFREESSLHDSVEKEERKLAPIFSFTPETSTLSEYVGNGTHVASDVAVQGSSLALP